MRGRAIFAEEFERLLNVTQKIRPHDSACWIHYLKGLWFSGLRLEESTVVSWDDDAPFMLDVSGKYPRFRIYGEAQKSGRDEYLPVTPDFQEFILATPESERVGRVFKLNGLTTGKQICVKRISRLVSKIGERAGVIVERIANRAIPDGPVKLKFASAHDLRRSFGSRWARKVTPAVLKRLMRHSDINTTMGYYVDLDSDDIAAELWQSYDSSVGVDTLVDTSPNQANSDSHESQETREFSTFPEGKRIG